MTLARSLKIEFADTQVDVTAYADGALQLRADAALEDYSGLARIVASKSGVSSSETVHLDVKNEAGNSIARFNAPEEVESVGRLLHWLSTDPVLSPYAVAAPENSPSPAPAQIMLTVWLGLIAVALLVIISLVLDARRSSIFSDVAFVGLPGLYLDVRSSGRLEYVKADGTLQTGELFATLRSSRGNPVFVEARHGGTVRQVLKQSGEFVSKGDPIAVVLDGTPKPYAAVFVKPSDAVPAIRTGKATITIMSTGETLEVALSSENIVLKPKRLVDERGVLLTEIDIPLPQKWESRMGEALRVEFDHARSTAFGWDLLSALVPFVESAFAGATQP